MDSCCNPSNEKTSTAPKIAVEAQKNKESTSFRVPQMDCPSEISMIQGKLEGVTGIGGMRFDLENRILSVQHSSKQISSEKIVRLLDAIGLKASVIEGEKHSDKHMDHEGMTASYIRLAVAGIFALFAEVVEFSSLGVPEWTIPVLAIASIFLSGLDVYKKGFISLSRAQLNISALMSIAVTGAIIIRQWPEAAMVMFLFAVAELIEAKAFDRARNAFKKLLDLAPDMTTVQSASGAWEERSTKDVPVEAVARVRPGERISLDGVIVRGSSTINQAPITGESVPVEKTVGDQVFAGTINEAAEFEFKVTSTATHSTLAKIVETVESAQGARAPTQRFIDKFSKYYTPAVFFIALAVAIAPPLFMGAPWLDWVYKALVLLVIACPCALVISTPVTIVSGLSGAAKRGILIKGGAYIEKGADLKVIALDKTGTITFGKPRQTNFEALEGSDPQLAQSMAASLASRSDHPVSQAIAVNAQEQGIAVSEVFDFTAIGGRGTKGKVNGEQYFLANHRLIEEMKICSPSVEAMLEKYEREGKTVAIFSTSARVLAVFAVVDTVRPTSRDAVKDLHKLGVKTVMLSGDNQLTAEKIAREIGIDEARGHLLPDGKMQAIQNYNTQNQTIGMVGDGINDAPALACADIGFSMGVAGTDVAIETSDVAIMDDDLRKIPQFIHISRDTKRILKQNITLSIGIKAVFFALTLAGVSTMWMAVFADTGASLLVVLNGLRLSRQ